MRSTVASMREWMPSVSAVPLPAMSSSSCVELVGAPAHDMQHRAEHFLAQFARAVELDDGRRAHKCPWRQRPIRVPAEAHRACLASSAIQRSSLALRLGVDHRPDMGRRIARIAELAVRARRPRSSRARGRRRPPAGTAAAAPSSAGRRSGRPSHDVVGDLLGQRGGIDDHGVDAAGLGDQRRDRPVLARRARG